MTYKEDDFLMLSGLQHFSFCRRQWALIHIETLWAENYQTTDGEIIHARAHDIGLKESGKDLIITRACSVFSPSLGVSGQCDVIEYRRTENGISLVGREGLWQPFPVEYKRGMPREDIADQLQLCGQAMCLEEMLCCNIPEGALYYNQIRRRVSVPFTPELRDTVKTCLQEMHDLYKRKYTPKVKTAPKCRACSLKDLCLPKLSKTTSVRTYIKKALEDEE